MSEILVTGGAGYIGSHTLVSLIESGYKPIVLDNFSNSKLKAVKRVEEITKRPIELYEYDLRDKTLLDSVFKKHKIEAVIHFAGFKAVGESVSKALLYYQNNLESTLTLLDMMSVYNVKKLIFSSSATIYGIPEAVPIKETSKKQATNPYGRTKLFIEEILEDIVKTNKKWQITSLRYFNPIGAHPSGLIGEDPSGVPNNLPPYITQVAVGKLSRLEVFGNDYDTPDGTGVRDYVHVLDLADAHVAALEGSTQNSYRAFNVGTGKGVSVLELIKIFEHISGTKINFTIGTRRPGDIGSCYADVRLINTALRWKAKRTVQEACESAWNWQQKNPQGFQ